MTSRLRHITIDLVRPGAEPEPLFALENQIDAAENRFYYVNGAVPSVTQEDTSSESRSKATHGRPGLCHWTSSKQELVHKSDPGDRNDAGLPPEVKSRVPGAHAVALRSSR